MSVIRTSDNAVIATIPVGFRPYAVAVSPDGSRVYVANSGEDYVSVIRTSDNTVIAGVPVPGSGGYDFVPIAVAVSTDGSLVYVASDSATVKVIDAATNTVVATVTMETGQNGVAVGPDGTVYVTLENNKVPVISLATSVI